MAYEVYLGRILFPIPPEKITVKSNGGNKTVTLISESEVNLLKSEKLKTVEFTVVLPQMKYPAAAYLGEYHSASYYLDQLAALIRSKRPVQFIVSRTLPSGKTLFSTNLKMALEDWEFSDDVKEGFDIAVKIKLKEYKTFGTKTVYIAPETPEVAKVEEERPAETSPEPQQTQTYTVKSGDCLWKIAKQFYGNGADYTKIFNANSDQISNPNLIYPGQTFVIPV